MTTKKILALAFCALTLCACGKSEPSESTQEPSEDIPERVIENVKYAPIVVGANEEVHCIVGDGLHAVVEEGEKSNGYVTLVYSIEPDRVDYGLSDSENQRIISEAVIESAIASDMKPLQVEVRSPENFDKRRWCALLVVDDSDGALFDLFHTDEYVCVTY